MDLSYMDVHELPILRQIYHSAMATDICQIHVFKKVPLGKRTYLNRTFTCFCFVLFNLKIH